MGRTNIVLDDELVAEGLKLTHARSIRELVHRSLADLVSRLKREKMLEMRGRGEWEGDLGDLRGDPS